MEALFLLIPLSLLALVVAIVIFLRMSSSGQFDDPESPAWRVLMDDDSTSGAATDAKPDAAVSKAAHVPNDSARKSASVVAPDVSQRVESDDRPESGPHRHG